MVSDFNAWTVEWASCFVKQPDLILLEALAMLDIDMVNIGKICQNGAESIIDATFYRP